VFVEGWPPGWARNYVTALKHVEGDRKMTEVILDILERFFASLPQDKRANAECDALGEAIRGPYHLYGQSLILGLPKSLQERVLDIIVKTRSRPSPSSR
jgi:hypothetical protein